MIKRTKQAESSHKGKPWAILCSDIHLMESSPVCRLDDFVEVTQWRKIKWLKDLATDLNCCVIHGGDLFHFWKPSPELLSKAIEALPSKFYTVYGNHDLPQHSMELAKKSGVYTLEKAGALQILQNGHWGEDMKEPTFASYQFSKEVFRSIKVQHIMTYQGVEPYVGCSAPKGATLLRKYPKFDLIVTGDNHVPFVEKHEGRLLVNPGSLFRTTASQIEHRPRVYIYYPESNTVEPIYVPIEEGVISRDHIEATQTRDARIEAFVDTLNGEWEAGMSFTENLKRYCDVNLVEKRIVQIINKTLE